MPDKLVRNIVITAFLVVVCSVIGTLLINSGTTLHEWAGHHAIAAALGCSSVVSTSFYQGATTFDCHHCEGSECQSCATDLQCDDGKVSTIDSCEDNVCHHSSRVENILIAFGSIFVVFFTVVALWVFFGENSVARLIAVPMFMYSTIPSAFPMLNGSDMSYAITMGFPLYLGWAIYVIMSGIMFLFFVYEITDRDFFKVGR